MAQGTEIGASPRSAAHVLRLQLIARSEPRPEAAREKKQK